jgi:site-specific DNA-methyltransferase (cytosine-N4-specific)
VGIEPHPARFPEALPEFFVRFLTAPDDLIVDIFAGSNTTGVVAEKLGRRWYAFEERPDYVAASIFRFVPDTLSEEELRKLYAMILAGDTINVSQFHSQRNLLTLKAGTA